MRAPAAALLALLLATTACAARVEPAPLAPHLRGFVPEDSWGARRGLRLGVGAFIDARGELDRVGQRPALAWRWYGVLRQGEVRSGDADFLGDVVEAARADAAATLARSGAFAAVRGVEAGDADALEPIRRGDVDLVLTATIEELHGRRSQNLVFSAALVGGMRNRLGEPSGVASLRFRLYDRAGLRLEYTVSELLESAGPGVAHAALDALAAADERLARRLFLELVPAAERRSRVLVVKLVDGCALGAAQSGQLVEEASHALEREGGIALRMEYEPAPARLAAPDLEQSLRRLEALELPGDAIAIALVPLPRRVGLAPGERFGLARQLGAHAVVACEPERGVRVVTLLHEIAHLFGAVHVRDRGSVMNPTAEFDARFLDPLNRRVLRASSARPPRGPLPPETARELAAIYRAAHRSGGEVDAAGLEAALRLVEQ